MEEQKLQALADSLSKHGGRKGLGTYGEYSWSKKVASEQDGERTDGLPNNVLYTNFVKAGAYDPNLKTHSNHGDGRFIKRNFSDLDDSESGDSLEKKKKKKKRKKDKEERKAAKKAAKVEAKRQAKLEEKRRVKRLAKLEKRKSDLSDDSRPKKKQRKVKNVDNTEQSAVVTSLETSKSDAKAPEKDIAPSKKSKVGKKIDDSASSSMGKKKRKEKKTRRSKT